MLKRVGDTPLSPSVTISEAEFPAPFASGLEYSPPTRGVWTIVHVGMLIPEAHEIFVCAGACLRGVVLSAAELNLTDRFSTVAIEEHNVLDGDMEELIVEGVTDILNRLPKLPPAVLVYSSCIHHFVGCDLALCYDMLRKRFPGVDFTDCYMTPTMRKSGLTPDQIMRRQLYAALKPRTQDPEAVAILGNDLPTVRSSEMYRLLEGSGRRIHEITACRSYEEYQRMAESSLYLTCYPPARHGAEVLAKRLGGRHLALSNGLSYEEIEADLAALAAALGVEKPDYTVRRQACESALEQLRDTVGDTPVAVDYTAVSRPASLARLLLEHGIRVFRLYLDSLTGEDGADIAWLQEHFPDLEICATVSADMRFAAPKEKTRVLAVGQKAAYFLNTDHFVNVVQNGGMHGYEAVEDLCALMRDAYLHEKDMKSLVQIKGLGCEEGCCI